MLQELVAAAVVPEEMQVAVLLVALQEARVPLQHITV